MPPAHTSDVAGLPNYGPRGMWWAGMAGLLTLGGCILGCTTGSKNDATWSFAFTQGITISRHVAETKEESSWLHIDQDIVSLWDKDKTDGADQP